MMNLLSINVGLPQEFSWKGKKVRTAIFKQPVFGKIWLSHENLDGDRQGDPRSHGGQYKAVYAYPGEHYTFWRRQLPGFDLAWGSFGENFTTQGLLEDEVCIGDVFQVGTAIVQVSEPRLPCYKLNLRFQREDILEKFQNSRRIGFYLSVLQEGQVTPGDEITVVDRHVGGITISEALRLRVFDTNDIESLKNAVQDTALTPHWRQRFQRQLEAASE